MQASKEIMQAAKRAPPTSGMRHLPAVGPDLSVMGRENLVLGQSMGIDEVDRY